MTKFAMMLVLGLLVSSVSADSVVSKTDEVVETSKEESTEEDKTEEAAAAAK